ncbi:UDP-N-acetylglucosamine transferase subunit alg13 [Ceratocystis lukuohia]|uniref:UDP-N-acetylglucosamine transferase subunit ALG13 n=1 Tax=Ceratocystis lukuohia TaxID=2019550 RepID=A0ABR4MGV0_9PEZI
MTVFLPVLPTSYHKPPRSRHCFVTVGATATFSGLLSAIQSADFLLQLVLAGFTHLTVQAGRDYEKFLKFSQTVDNTLLTIECFDLKPSLARDMALCRENAGVDKDLDVLLSLNLGAGSGPDAPSPRDLGVVISHAGTGSVLDAMAARAPMVVVPNESLLDNHQRELAQMVEDRKYGVVGTLTTLASDIRRAQSVLIARESQIAEAVICKIPPSEAHSLWDIAQDLVRPTSTAGKERESDEVQKEG